jgi:hypothetical protein
MAFVGLIPSERSSGAKKARVTELGRNRKGRQIVDATEAPQSLDARPQRREIEERPQVVFNRLEARDGLVEGAQIRAMRLIESGQWPRLGAKPGVMPLRPRSLRRREAAPVAEEEFREAMPRAEEIGANVFATSEQIARGFFLLGRDVDGGQRLGAIEHGQLTRIPPIGLDAITGATWNEGRSNDLARNLFGSQGALQVKAARPRFIAAADGALALQAGDEPHDGR